MRKSLEENKHTIIVQVEKQNVVAELVYLHIFKLTTIQKACLYWTLVEKDEASI